MPSIESYLDKITGWHRARPKFVAMVRNLLDLPTQQQAIVAQMLRSFDLDTAVGDQLDTIGEWIGRSRIVSILANTYFSWDTAGLGWNQGNWKGPYDPSVGLVSLDDYHYRILLRAKIGSNNWDGTPGEAIQIIATLFGGPDTLGFIQDNQDMTVTLGLSGKLPSAVTIALLKGGYISLRPMGVKAYYFVTSVDTKPIFGWDVDNSYLGGWDKGAWGVSA